MAARQIASDEPIIIRGEDAKRLIQIIKAEVMLHVSYDDEKQEVEIDWDDF